MKRPFHSPALAGVLATMALAGVALSTWLSSEAESEPSSSLSPESRRPLSMCFAPGTPIETVEEVHASLYGGQGGSHFFRAPDRWTATATDGFGILRGDPITLTWGIIADGTVVPDFDGPSDPDSGPSANSDLRSRLNGLYGNEATWLPLFQAVFDRWGEVTGITYVYEANDDSADLGSASGSLGVRPDIRIGGRLVDGNSNVLAFNFFPNNGDMVIDTADSFFDNTSNDSIRLRNVLSHEHGHGIGLSHVCPSAGTKLMEPFLSIAFEGPQHDEIRGGQRQYGDRYEDNDSVATATPLGQMGNGIETVDTVSLDGDQDEDFFSFTTDQPNKELAVTLAPVGFSYLEAAQNGDGSCPVGTLIDSSDDRNLALQVLGSDGVTVLASADLVSAGQAETLQLTLGASSGPFYARVHGDAVDAVQLYQLDIALADVSNDLSVAIESTPEPVSLGGIQTIEVTVSFSGPADATQVMAGHTLPPGLQFLSASLTSGSGTVSESAGTVTADIGTMTGASSVTFEILARRLTAALPDLQVSVTRGEADSDPTNDTASFASTVVLVQAQDVEEFDAFPGLSGEEPQIIPNDTTGDFNLLYGNATTTVTGFALDEIQSENGRGLTYEAGEDTALWHSEDFSSTDYSSSSHQLAFRFRFTNVSAAANGSRTQLIAPFNAGATSSTDVAYLFRCGKDSLGTQGAGVEVPTDGTTLTEQAFIALSANAWHTCVIQYTSATDSTTANAGLKLWFNPTDAAEVPDLEIDPSSGLMGSYFGAGSLVKYGLGATYFVANDDGPTVWIDRIATWDGFGTVGDNDLQSAIDVLNPVASVYGVNASLVEGDGGPTTFDFTVVRSGDVSVPAVYNWSVTGAGLQPADGADFVGGTFPFGTLNFAEGETFMTVEVNVSGDFDVELNEEFQVSLSSGGAKSLVSPTNGTASATIENDDAETEVALDLADNLLITDANSDTADTLILQSDTLNSQLLVMDPNQILRTPISGALGNLTNSIQVPFTSILGPNILVQTGNLSDVLTVDFTLGSFTKPVSFVGGDPAVGPGDSLVLANGTFTDGTFLYIDESSGSVALDIANVIQYTELEPILSDVDIANPTFQYSDSDDVILISFPVAGQTQIDSDFGEMTTFRVPTGTLTVNGGLGADELTLNGLEAAYGGNVILDGEAGVNLVHLAANISFAAGKTFTINNASTNLLNRQVEIDGNLVLGGDLALNLAGLNVGADYDQLQLAGASHTIDLTSSTLTLDVTFNPSVNDVFTVVDVMDPSSSVVGTFIGLAEGDNVTSGAETFIISYVGGTDGNDVVLTTTLGFGEWATGAFVTAPPSEQTPLSDPDADGWLNCLEYLLGTDAESFDEDPVTIAASDTETTITYTRTAAVPEGIETLEYSPDMTTWTMVTPSNRVVNPQGAIDLVTLTVPTDPERLFYRLSILVGEH